MNWTSYCRVLGRTPHKTADCFANAMPMDDSTPLLDVIAERLTEHNQFTKDRELQVSILEAVSGGLHRTRHTTYVSSTYRAIHDNLAELGFEVPLSKLAEIDKVGLEANVPEARMPWICTAVAQLFEEVTS